jgi:hypothetical protein
MARGPLTFKKRDFARALEAAASAGRNVTRAEIEKDGKIILVFGEDVQDCTAFDDWDKALSNDR